MLAAQSMIKTRWVLREFMSRYRITNRELGEEWGRHENSISRLKRVDEMPALSSDELDALCNALTRILRKHGEEYVVTYSDLLEHKGSK